MPWRPHGFANRLFVDSTAAVPMPKIRRRSLPPPLLHHLLDRIRSHEISASQIGLFADWLDTEPEVKMVQAISRNDSLRRSRFGEDVSTSRTGSDWQRSAVAAFAIRNSHFAPRSLLSSLVVRCPLSCSPAKAVFR